MQVSLKQYFTISPHLLLNVSIDSLANSNKNIRLNIFLNDPDFFSAAFFTKVGSLKNDYIFSLSLDLVKDEAILKSILPKLYLLSTLNICSKKYEVILPVFCDKRPEPGLINTDLIVAYFNSQGITDVKIPFFNYHITKDSIQNTIGCSFIFYSANLQGGLNPIPLAQSTGQQLSDVLIIGFEEDIISLALFEKAVKQFVSLTGNNIPLHVFDHLSEYYIEKELFVEEKEFWKNRALLYQDFLSLRKTVHQKEYDEMMEWYRREYESLPLWYKRFGHIIKVLMGKRSFRSLFNDSIKKYKD